MTISSTRALFVLSMACIGMLAHSRPPDDSVEHTTGSPFETLVISKASNGGTYLLSELPVFEVTYKMPIKLPDISLGHGGLWGLEVSRMELETTKEVFGYEAFGKISVLDFLKLKIGWGPIIDRDGFVSYPLRAELVARF